METKSKKLDDGKVEITVVLSAEEVQKEFDAAYKQASKNRIPGFRPGKAPRKVLENVFGGKEYFQAVATDELVRAYSPLAPDELNLIALKTPEFSDSGMATEGESFTYVMTIEVAPEFELSSYDPVQIELPSAEPTDEEMQAQIDALLSYNITTDEDGKEIVPELTDAWVKEAMEFENVDEFKERLAESIRAQKSQDLPMVKEVRTTTELASRLVGEVPEDLIRQTEQDNYRDLFQSLQQQHMTLDTYLESYGYTPETFRDSMHEQAKSGATMGLALDALARHLKLEATEDDIIAEFENSGAKDAKALYENWRKNGRLSEIRQGILRMKAALKLDETAEIFEPGTLTKDEKPAKKTRKTAASKTKADETEATEKKPARKTTKKTAEKDDAAAEKKPARTTKAKTEKKPAEKTDKTAK